MEIFFFRQPALLKVSTGTGTLTCPHVPPRMALSWQHPPHIKLNPPLLSTCYLCYLLGIPFHQCLPFWKNQSFSGVQSPQAHDFTTWEGAFKGPLHAIILNFTQTALFGGALLAHWVCWAAFYRHLSEYRPLLSSPLYCDMKLRLHESSLADFPAWRFFFSILESSSAQTIPRSVAE